jgi:hypothetical protein
VHDDRNLDTIVDLLDDVEVEGLVALELVGAVAGADGGGEGVATGGLDEGLGLLGLGEVGVTVLDLDVLFDATEGADLGLDGDALLVGGLDDALGGRAVLFKRLLEARSSPSCRSRSLMQS